MKHFATISAAMRGESSSKDQVTDGFTKVFPIKLLTELKRFKV
jgi:hypothetical protein